MQTVPFAENLKKIKAGWQQIPLEKRMFYLMLVFYFSTRLIGLTRYPIYFFGDEAVQMNRAADLVRDRGVGYDGMFLPTFFANNNSYILGTSVYLQILPYLLFGRSVWAVRFAPMLVSLLAAVWVSLTLRDVLAVKHWWSAGFLLSVAPAWFLHSRTAFETALFVTFYAGFLYHYLMYRKGHHRHLLWSLFWGSVAFYSYTAGQIVMVVSGVLFFLFDLKYHWQQRKWWPLALLVLAICVVPLVRFLLVHPQEFSTRLVNYNSYWAADTSFWEKAWRYIREYQRGRSVPYWFFPHEQDMFRHTMTGYGHIHWTTLPLMALGIWRLLADHRKDGVLVTILAAAMAAPSGAAAIEIGITRVLVTMVPVVISAGLGLQWLLDWLQTKVFKGWKRGLLVRLVFLLLVAFNCFLLWDALTNGPTWSTNYGLHGMQWGAQAVFKQVRAFRAEDADVHIDLTPNWANNYNEVERFFLPRLKDLTYITHNSLDGYRTERRFLTPESILLVTPEEYATLPDDPLFGDVAILDTIEAPDGSAAFYWIRLQYSENAEAVFEKLEEQRSLPVEDVLILAGQEVAAAHSVLDMGEFKHLTDGDLNTVIRTGGANPLVITLHFADPQPLDSIALLIGSGPAQLQVKLVDVAGDQTIYDLTFPHVRENRWAFVAVAPTLQAKMLEIKLWNTDQAEPGHVHLWEMVLNTPREELP